MNPLQMMLVCRFEAWLNSLWLYINFELRVYTNFTEYFFLSNFQD